MVQALSTPLELVTWVSAAKVAALEALVLELEGLIERGNVSLFIHCETAEEAATEDLIRDVRRRHAGLAETSRIRWGDVYARSGSHDALAWFESEIDERVSEIAGALRIPVCRNLYEVESACVERGILAASTSAAFCPLPWTLLHLESDGVATPCANAPVHEGGPSLATHSLPVVYNSPLMRRVRVNMLNGVRDAACRDCWRQEDVHGRSARRAALTKTRKTAETLAAEARAVTDAEGAIGSALIAPTKIDVRWSNICNFRCRMCWHASSSSWFDDARAISEEDSRLDPTDKRRLTVLAGDKALITFNDDGLAVRKLLPFLENVQTVYCAGGEPLIMDEHFELLQALQSKKRNILLAYNTNLSKLDFKGHNLVDMWQGFKHVHLGISVDGLGPVGEYVRTGFKTDRFLKNLECVREAATSRTFSYSLHVTVSSYNAPHVAELLREMVARNYVSRPGQVTMSLVRNPLYASPMALPRELRAHVVEDLKAIFDEIERQCPRTMMRRFNSHVLRGLSSSDDALFGLHRQEVWEWLGRLDRLRDTSWKEVVPHMQCFAPAN